MAPAYCRAGAGAGARRAGRRGAVVLLAPEQRITTGCCQGSSAKAGDLALRRGAARHGRC
ncbi:hypothetical protein [Sorangium sp. So ce1078]|uniref:hypothetical protein n=1 Tax=Sorangium sp. So ce1078 TaxID=3133329 RepID=UPI003F6293C4